MAGTLFWVHETGRNQEPFRAEQFMEFFMRKMTLAIAAATMSVPVAMTLPAAPAEAQRYYDRGGNYVGPTWRGRDGRYRCRRPDGTTGLIVGGAAGALIGREIGRSC